MNGLGIIFLCIGIGLFLRLSRSFPENTPVILNRFVLHVSLPALTLFHLHRIGSEGIGISPAWPALMAWIVLLTSIPFFIFTAWLTPWDRPTIGALILTAGLGNTSFVGFALLEALYGPQALPIAVLTDSPGSFLAMATIGIGVASSFSGLPGRKKPLGQVFMRILKFPPFIALILSFLLRSVPFPEALGRALERLGETMIPLALISVGMELRVSIESLKRNARALGAGLAYKLILAPALVFALYVEAGGMRGLPARVIVLESAMAPMITGAIISTEYGLNPELATLMIGLGIPLSLASVPLWHLLLRHFNI